MDAPDKERKREERIRKEAIGKPFLKKISGGKLAEKSIPPEVGMEQSLCGATLEGTGEVEGLDGGKAGAGIRADFAPAGVSGDDVSREAPRDRAAGDGFAERGKEAPGTVKEEDRQVGIVRAEGRSPDFEEEEARSIKGEAGGCGVEAQVRAVPKGFEAALGFSLPRMPDNDVNEGGLGHRIRPRRLRGCGQRLRRERGVKYRS
jgi:hypothetical protein